MLSLKRIVFLFLATIGVNQHLSAEQRQDVANAVIHAAPGAGASVAAQAWGLTPANLLTFLSVTFMILQIGYLVWKWRRQVKIDADRRSSGEDLGPTD